MKKPLDPLERANGYEENARQMRWHAEQSRKTADEFDKQASVWETRAAQLRSSGETHR